MERHIIAVVSAILHVTVCAGLGWAAKHYTTLDPFLLALFYIGLAMYSREIRKGDPWQ